jgi:hypothetical protein
VMLAIAKHTQTVTLARPHVRERAHVNQLGLADYCERTLISFGRAQFEIK